MHRVDAQGNWYAGGGIVSDGVTVNGALTLQAVNARFLFAAPGTALIVKDAADGQVKIINDDGMIYTLTGTHAPAPTPSESR
jgi:hypothetical protein